jgi:hypothetical protein
LLSLAATWPLVTHLRGWVPGLGDWGQNMWALWWTRHSLLSLAQSPFFTNHLFYPEGVTLLFHPLDVSDGLLALPLYGLFGGDISYNLMILASFVLGGWGAYLLALYLTKHRAASFIAGLVFALSPYHFLRIDLGHLNLSTLQWIPFYTLFLLKFVQKGSKRSAVLAVFFLMFTALNSWYYVVYCGLLSLAIICWPGVNRPKAIHQLARVRPGFSSHQWFIRVGRIGLVLIAAIIILSPLLVPMFQLLGTMTLVGAHDPLRHSVDLFGFWAPGPPSIWAGWFEDVWISYAAQNREPGASAYVGYTVLVVSLIGVIDRRRRKWTRWWLVVALGFTLLAMGPQLQLDGQLLGVSLPYQWLADLIPIFSITGIPGRFVVMTSLALAMLAAYGLASLTDWLLDRSSSLSPFQPHPKRACQSPPLPCSYKRSGAPLLPRPPAPPPLMHRPSTYLSLIVSLLIIFEYLAVPVRLTPTKTADFYRIVASDTETYAVLDIKWDANFLMHAQTVHGKPLIGGWLARLPQDQATYLDQGSLDRVFLYLLLGAEGATLTDLPMIQPAIQAELARRDVRYIVDHDRLAGPWIEQIVGWPVAYTEDNLVVYGKQLISQ